MTHPRPTLAETGRAELAAARTCTLSTLDRDDGTPFGSLVDVLPTPTGAAVLLLSSLAEHTRNALADPRASLTFGSAFAHPLPQLCARVTVLGKLEPRDIDAETRTAYLAAHPHARRFVDFGDFRFFELVPNRVRLVAGFGRMGWIDRATWADTEPELMHAARAGVISHMNDDHRNNLKDYVRAFAGINSATDAIMLSLDRLGFDVAAIVDGLPQPVRINFPEPLAHPRMVRAAMVELAHKATAALARTEDDA